MTPDERTRTAVVASVLALNVLLVGLRARPAPSRRPGRVRPPDHRPPKLRRNLTVRHAACLLLLCLLPACVLSGSRTPDKASMGNLEVHVYAPDDLDIRRAEIHMDDVYLGNATATLPVLFLTRGQHVMRVLLPGCLPYERRVAVLGEPNHQVLNVFLTRDPAAKLSDQDDLLRAMAYVR